MLLTKYLAKIQKMKIKFCLNAHFGLNVRMGIVTHKLKIFKSEVIEGAYIGVDFHYWQGSGRARQLKMSLVQVV